MFSLIEKKQAMTDSVEHQLPPPIWRAWQHSWQQILSFIREQQSIKRMIRNPCLVFIWGATQSGKSSLLSHSGMTFLSHEVMKSACPPTLTKQSAFNWWFSEQFIFCEISALFIETEIIEEQWVWQYFVKQLHRSFLGKYTQKHFYCFDVPRLLSHTPFDIRVWPPIRALSKNKLPMIYFYLSQVDFLRGFHEFFADLSTESAKKIAGTVITDSRPNKKWWEACLLSWWKTYLSAFDDQLLSQLQNEHHLSARVLIRDFPDALSTLTPHLQHFFHEAQASAFDCFGQHCDIAGFFLGSAKQTQKTQDVLLPLFDRTANIDATFRADIKPISRPYFLRDIFESLQSVNKNKFSISGLLPKAYKQKWANVTSMMLVVFCAVFLSQSIMTINQMVSSLHYAENTLVAYPLLANDIERIHQNDRTWRNILPLLSLLQESERTLTEFTLPGGTHQNRLQRLLEKTMSVFAKTDVLQKKTQTIYRHTLNRYFLPEVATTVTNILTSNTPRSPQVNYAALEIYLMLAEPQHRVFSDFDHAWRILSPIENISPADTLRIEKAMHDAWQLNNEPYAINPNIVYQTRTLLSALSEKERLAILLSLSGMNGNGLMPNTQSFYNPDLFQQHYKNDLVQAIGMAQNGNWVFGPLVSDPLPSDTHLQTAYIDQFIAWWRNELNAKSDADFLGEVQTELSDPHSPLQTVLHLSEQNRMEENKLTQIFKNVTNFIPQLSSDTTALDWAKIWMNQSNDTLSIAEKESAEITDPALSAWLKDIFHRLANIGLAHAANAVNTMWANQITTFVDNKFQAFPFISDSRSSVAMTDFNTFFNPNGLYPKFLSSYIDPFVNTDNAVWTLKQKEGLSLPINTLVLDKLLRLSLITPMFYTHHPLSPVVHFSLQLMSLEDSIGLVKLIINDERLDDTMGDAKSHPVIWPGGMTNTGALLLFVDGMGKNIEENYPGDTWGWFRLLQHAAMMRTDDPKKWIVIFDVNGRSAKYLLTTDSVLNPFVDNFIEGALPPKTLLSGK